MARQDIFTKKLADAEYQFLSPTRMPVSSKTKSYLKCWVCEGWKEKEFIWKNGKSGDLRGEPMYIHFAFDDWQPWLMQGDGEGR